MIDARQIDAMARTLYTVRMMQMRGEPGDFSAVPAGYARQWYERAAATLDALHAAGWTLAPLPTPGAAGKAPVPLAAIADIAYPEFRRASFIFATSDKDAIPPDNDDRRFWPIDKPLPWWRKFWPF